MTWLRDRLGRFSRPRPSAVAETAETAETAAPSLSPMMQHAISWLQGSRAGDRLATMLAEPQPATRRERIAEPETPLEQVLGNAVALAERPLAPLERDESRIWHDLSDEGYTFEACKLIAEHSARTGMHPRKAAEHLDAVSRPEPAVSSGRSWRNLDRMAERENERAYEALSVGDFETWERYSLPAALRAVRGG